MREHTSCLLERQTDSYNYYISKIDRQQIIIAAICLSNLCTYKPGIYTITIAFSFSFLIMQTPIGLGIYETLLCKVVLILF